MPNNGKMQTNEEIFCDDEKILQTNEKCLIKEMAFCPVKGRKLPRNFYGIFQLFYGLFHIYPLFIVGIVIHQQIFPIPVGYRLAVATSDIGGFGDSNEYRFIFIVIRLGLSDLQIGFQFPDSIDKTMPLLHIGALNPYIHNKPVEVCFVDPVPHAYLLGNCTLQPIRESHSEFFVCVASHSVRIVLRVLQCTATVF